MLQSSRLFALARRPVFSVSSKFLPTTTVHGNCSENAWSTQTQQRNTVGSNFGRMRVNLTKTAKKLDELLHPNPEDKAKKFRKKKLWFPTGESKEQQREKAKQLNPAGTKKVHKISPRNKELVAAIFEAGKAHDPEAAFEAYHRLSTVPDVRCFTALIKSCETKGEYLGEAVQIYQDVKKLRLPVNAAIYQTLLNCCVAAKHWQRGMYFLKEYLAHVNIPKKPTAQHLRLFVTLLRLLYQEGQMERISFVYDLMREKNIFMALTKEGEEYKQPHHKNIPLTFVQLFVPKDHNAQEVLEQLMKVRDPSYSKDESLDDLFATPAESQLSSFQYYKNQLLRGPSYNNTLDAHTLIEAETNISTFDQYFKDFEVDKIMRATYDNFYNEAVDELEQFMQGKFKMPEEKLVGLNAKENSKALELIESKEKELLVRAMTAPNMEEALQVRAELSEYKKKVRSQFLTKLDWKPVIIGVDGKPFFPKSISVERITGDTVEAAKREYLESIEDETARKEVSAELQSRIKLCWYHAQTGEIVEGLFY
jgi:hypothetical protein